MRGRDDLSRLPLMPRPPRLDLPGIPVHLVQRGVNRAACFFGDVDRHYYLKLLAKFAAKRECALHAYALMTNHVHLLITPARKGALAALMQDLGRSYVRTMNAVHGRTGTLWEGRFKSSLVDSERYFLVCQRYIELNPVRAGLVGAASEYPWSSYRHYARGEKKPFITEHECFLRLGTTNERRREAYEELFAEEMSRDELARIRAAANSSSALGAEDFVDRLRALTGRPVSTPRRGRPSKAMVESAVIPDSDKLL